MSKTRVSNPSTSDGPLECGAHGCENTIALADYSIQCDLCKSHFHHRCIDFSDANFHAYSRLYSSGLVSYFCPPCKADISQLAQKDSRAGNNDDRLSKVEQQLGGIKATLDILIGKPALIPEASGPVPTDGSTPSYASVAAKGAPSPGRVVTVSDLHKVKEEEGHRRSLVVAGLPEMGNDIEAATSLCRFLDPSACVSDVFRMGRVPRADPDTPDTPTRPRLLKVHLPSSSVVKSVLGEAPKLKQSSDFKGVFIRRSMTREERQELSKIRDQCNDLNTGESTEGVKYVVLGKSIVRFNGCQKEGVRLVGGTRDRSWSPPPPLN